MTVMLVCGLKKEKENHYTLNRGKAVLTMGSTSSRHSFLPENRTIFLAVILLKRKSPQLKKGFQRLAANHLQTLFIVPQ